MINIYFADKRQPNENSSTKYLYILVYNTICCCCRLYQLLFIKM